MDAYTLSWMTKGGREGGREGERERGREGERIQGFVPTNLNLLQFLSWCQVVVVCLSKHVHQANKDTSSALLPTAC